MLATAFDLAQGCAVLIMGPPCGDAGWRAYIRAIDELQSRLGPEQRPILIQVLRSGIDVPSAVVRRELAMFRKRIRPDAVNAVVVKDAGLRLLQTALDWIHRPHYESSSHADLATALGHVETILGRPVPVLARLCTEADERFRTAPT